MAKNDDTQTAEAAAPAETPMHDVLRQLAAAMQGEAEVVRRRERDAIGRMLDSHDKARETSKKVKLKAVTGFMLVTDDNPEGKSVNRGDEFEVSEFDLPRYLGRGLPTTNEPTEKSGVTISQA